MRSFIVVICFVAFVVVSQTYAYVDIKDGQTHDIDYQFNNNEHIRVDYGSPGLQTTINWLDGASISGGYSLWAYEDSRINIKGGTTGSLMSARGRSQVTISGGTVWLGAFDNSRVDIFGGTTNQADIGSYAQANLYAGSVGSFSTSQSGWVRMSGGTVTGSIQAYNTSRVDITSGIISGNIQGYLTSQIDIRGADISGNLTGSQSSIFSIHGSNFMIDGQSVGYGELTSLLGGVYVNEPIRHLTGTLAMGGFIDSDFQLGTTSKIVLIPEPATLLLFGLGGLMLKRRRV